MQKSLNIPDEIILNPIFENSIPIAFSSSNYFTPYLAVTIQSIIEKSTTNNNYDLVVFTKDMSENNKNILTEMVNKHENFNIRFVNVQEIFSNLDLYAPGHVTIETYFRLVIPLFMKNYKKILFLDSDLCILEDVANLYNIDINDHSLAAAEECLMSALVGIYGECVKDYMKDKLGLKNIDKYFQAGVMVVNVEKFIRNDYSNILLDMVSTFNYNIVDQDAMNKLLNNDVLWISNEWNYPPLQKHMKEVKYLENMSPYIREKYLAVKEPKILHYADREKPWFYPDEDYAKPWWAVARKTPYYELIIANMIDKHLSDRTNMFINYRNYKKNVLNYWKCKIMRTITFGRRKQHYVEKCNGLKEKIRQIRDLT